MNDDLAFLLNAAGQLRELAQTAPEIATTLRQLADDLEATAVEHSQDRQRGARVDD
jgi:hypothetical protein